MEVLLDQKKIEELILALIPVSRDAGNAILEVYNRPDFGIVNKEDQSPLTEADLASNKIICDALKGLSPEIPIISEENTETSFEERATWEYCWVVDPLDGTKEFIKRNGEFTTNIGLVHKHEVIAGVVFVPEKDLMYYAIKGEGAFMIQNGQTRQLTSNAFNREEEGLKVVCSRSHLNDKTQEFVDGLTNPELVSRGSSLKFLTIAQGNADLYPRMAPTMEWDTCAAQIILEEAGGSVTVDGTNEALKYNKENLLNPFFLAKGNEV